MDTHIRDAAEVHLHRYTIGNQYQWYYVQKYATPLCDSGRCYRLTLKGDGVAVKEANHER